MIQNHLEKKADFQCHVRDQLVFQFNLTGDFQPSQMSLDDPENSSEEEI